MSEKEVSEILQKLIINVKEFEKNYEQSEEIISLQNRILKIEEESGNELSEESKNEIEQITIKANMIYEQGLQKLLENITQRQMIDILKTITPEFNEKNHVETFALNKTIAIFLNKIDDPSCKIYNDLLFSRPFINVVESSNECLKQLLDKSNDEKVVLDFLENYSHNFSKYSKENQRSATADWGDFGIIIKTVINSKNYSDEFKDYILANQKLLPYISGKSFETIIIGSNFLKKKKLQLLTRPDIFNALSDFEFSLALGKICENYEEYQAFIKNKILSSKIDIGVVLSESILQPEELKKLLLDEEICNQITGIQLSHLLSSRNIDFDTKKSMLLNENLFSKLSGFEMALALGNKCFNSKQRFELLNDERVYKKIVSENTVLNINQGLFQNYGIISGNTIPILDQVAIVKNEKFRNYVNKEVIQDIMSNSDLDLEIANDILFDKHIFYRLIKEWNDEYNCPDDFYGYKGPYKYDKYEYVQKLSIKNPYIARTLVYDLLKDDILDLGFDFIEKISKYPYESQLLAGALTNSKVSPEYLRGMIKSVESLHNPNIDTVFYVTRFINIISDSSYFSENPKEVKKFSKMIYTTNFDTSKFSEENWKTITEIGLRDMSLYYNDVSSDMFGIFKDNIDISLNILPDINTIDDLNNYSFNRMALCDEYFKKAISQNNLENAKNAYLNKYFSINIQEAKEIVRMFGHSIQSFANNPEYSVQTKYIEQLKEIINIQKIDVVVDVYTHSNNKPFSFEEMVSIDSLIKQMFSSQISNSVYKVTDRILNENQEYVFNQPKEMEFVVEENGIKISKKVPVYEPGYDFKMLVHSTAAYGQMQLINNNYFDSWNKSSRKSNHGICCSLIANDNLGIAMVNDVLLGFDSWDSKSITKIAPYDIYSFNDGYDIQEGRLLSFMSAQDIIDNTRHTHNELVLERYELRDKKRNLQCQNIQPSYVIIHSDMQDEIKQNAIKCSAEMNIPIVFLDKEKIIQHEVTKIDEKISELNRCNSMELKLNLLGKILLSHENNRSGLKASNKDWIEKYFPTSKIEILLERIIMEIQSTYQETKDISEYFKNSNYLMEILEKENKKFENTMENVERANYIDIPVEDYKVRLIQYINPNLCKNGTTKLSTIIKINQTEKPDMALSQTFSKIDFNYLNKQIEDIMLKSLYQNSNKSYNVEHIERVLFLTQLIGKQELKLDDGSVDEYAVNLLTECAKYHDCGRNGSFDDKGYGQKSAIEMLPYLHQDNFSESDIRIMQVIVEYHAEVADDFRFEKICEKYGIEANQKDYIKKIANCLKDADALDRTRFLNQDSKLNIQLLNLEYSKELVPIIKELNNAYEIYDKQQFARYCQYLSNQNNLLEHFELTDEGRKM